MAEQKKKPAKSGSTAKKKTSNSRGKSSAKAQEAKLKKEKNDRIKDEIWSIALIAVGVFFIVALQTEAAGQLGHGVKNLLMGCFGVVAYILPYYLVVYGVLLFTRRAAHLGSRSAILVLLIFFMMTLLNSARYIDGNDPITLSYFLKMFNAGVLSKSGGAFGMLIGLMLVKVIGMVGLYILSVFIILISVLLVMNTPFSQFIDKMKENRKRRLSLEELDEEDEESQDGLLIADGSEKEHGLTSFEKGTKEPKKYNPAKDGIKPTISRSQMKILSYMRDDGLFEVQGEQERGFGLELNSEPAASAGSEECLHNKVIETPVDIQEIRAAFEEPSEPLIPKTPPLAEMEIPEVFEEIAAEEAAEILDFPAEEEEPQPQTSPVAAAAAIRPTEAPEIPHRAPPIPKKYQFPGIDLLNQAPKENNVGENEQLKVKAMKLEQTLHDFNVNAKVIQVTKGPAVTRYEIQPNTGVKVSSIVRLADDIALNLEAKSIRLEAPIPGKAAVGIEVENDRVNMVTIREILESSEFKAAKSKITFAVGKDISGKAIVADLKSMPHMLIAGSTGSGKSVCINSIIVSLLYKARPDEVKFVLVDPKVVELGNYNGIPHLLIPVVTDPSKAAAALNWAVAEMTDRYKKFAEEGVRDLASYNERVKEKQQDDLFLPQIVIIIDELADLMMAAPSQVEESICRLAQMARAAGMHLIVATQRPSVDIITGVIKANIPSRIAFAVSSQFDSRTILDMAGAEKLVGKGDMLFNPLGMAKPTRVQGTFISDSEVHNVIEFVKSQFSEAEYSNDVIHSIEKVQSAPGDTDGDELLSDAIEAVVKAKQASVSMLQRRFRVGYNRAARLVDMMEARGIIGPADGSRPRQVFLTEEELHSMDEELKD